MNTNNESKKEAKRISQRKWYNSLTLEEKRIINENRKLKLTDEKKAKIKENKRNRHNFRYKNDLNYKLKMALRCRLNMAIKRGYKAGSAVKNLGCSIEEFKKYIENQFFPNPRTGESMTWSNWSKNGWHIDHHIPLDKFDLENKQDFLMACHYSNLKPLWAKDNLQKSNKVN